MDLNAFKPCDDPQSDLFTLSELRQMGAFAATLPYGSLDLESVAGADPDEAWINSGDGQSNSQVQQTYFCVKHHDGNFGVRHECPGGEFIHVDGLRDLGEMFDVIRNLEGGLSLLHPRAQGQTI